MLQDFYFMSCDHFQNCSCFFVWNSFFASTGWLHPKLWIHFGIKQPSSIFEFYDEQSIASILQDAFAITNHRIIDVIDVVDLCHGIFSLLLRRCFYLKIQQLPRWRPDVDCKTEILRLTNCIYLVNLLGILGFGVTSFVFLVKWQKCLFDFAMIESKQPCKWWIQPIPWGELSVWLCIAAQWSSQAFNHIYWIYPPTQDASGK